MSALIPETRVDPASPSGLRLSQRLLLWFLLLSLGPIAVVASHAYYVASNSLTRASKDDLRLVAQHRVDLLRAWIAERRGDLDFMLETARRPCPCGCLEDDEVTVARACDYIANSLECIEHFERIELYDLRWQLQQSTHEPDTHRDFWDGTGIRSALTQGQTQSLSHAHLSSDAALCVCLGGELKDNADTPIGYLLAAARFSDDFRELLWSHDPERSGTSLLVADAGAILAGSAPADSLDLEESVLALLAEHAGNAEYRRGDRQVLAGYARIPEIGAVFVVERDKAVAFAWLGSLAWQISLVAITCVLVVSFVSRQLANSLTQPLRQLVQATKTIGLGGLAARVPALRGVDFHEVGAAFNRMLDQLERSERRLVETASLAAAGELSTSVVHELRNPLSSVRMNLQALRNKVEDDAVHRELADIANEQVCRIDRMLGDLLDFARPLALRQRPTPLAGVLQSAIPSVSADVRQREIQLEVANGLPEEVLSIDPDRLCQALTNLLQNAVHASPEGAPLSLSVRAGAAGRDIEIEIRDRGPGLAEDNLDRLFKPFFTTKANGSGLGLANARKVVRLQGGDLTARNARECGAIFTLSLPRTGDGS